MHAYRTHKCGELRATDAGAAVKLSGWIHRKRDHGGLMFIDLRDHYGLTQLVLSPETPGFATAERARAESVIRVEGEVVARSPETTNADLPTGAIEVRVKALDVLGEAAELPVPVFGEPDYPEDLRLKYRYLDLRRETLHRNIVLRSKVISSIRNRMVEAGFTEFQTPILTASSPEGARDFLVPSRMHPGEFYALPQAPQQFKQLLMVSGFDRYFQIAPCFRDEDARADRSPGEFYQLDLEMSFVTQEDVFTTIEPVMRGVFEEFAGARTVTTGAFPRIPYRTAIQKYGTDKPDLRNPIEMQDVSEHFRGGGFGVFARILDADPKARIWAIPAPGGGSRAFCDRMDSWAKGEGQPGMAYINFKEATYVTEDDVTVVAQGPVAKNLGVESTEARPIATRQLKAGFRGTRSSSPPATPRRCTSSPARRAPRSGTDLNLVAENEFRLCWIVDFPMFEWNEEEKRVDFSATTRSRCRRARWRRWTSQDPLDILAYQYDIVCNGVELSSGAIRNHRPDIMLKAFEIAGYGPEVVEDKFGGMLNAFRYGAPPHGGIAPGIDRIVMLLAGTSNIREVIAFPLNQQARDLLMQAPAPVSDRQTRELHIRLAPPVKG